MSAPKGQRPGPLQGGGARQSIECVQIVAERRRAGNAVAHAANLQRDPMRRRHDAEARVGIQADERQQRCPARHPAVEDEHDREHAEDERGLGEEPRHVLEGAVGDRDAGTLLLTAGKRVIEEPFPTEHLHFLDRVERLSQPVRDAQAERVVAAAESRVGAAAEPHEWDQRPDDHDGGDQRFERRHRGQHRRERGHDQQLGAKGGECVEQLQQRRNCEDDILPAVGRAPPKMEDVRGGEIGGEDPRRQRGGRVSGDAGSTDHGEQQETRCASDVSSMRRWRIRPPSIRRRAGPPSSPTGRREPPERLRPRLAPRSTRRPMLRPALRVRRWRRQAAATPPIACARVAATARSVAAPRRPMARDAGFSVDHAIAPCPFCSRSTASTSRMLWTKRSTENSSPRAARWVRRRACSPGSVSTPTIFSPHRRSSGKRVAARDRRYPPARRRRARTRCSRPAPSRPARCRSAPRALRGCRSDAELCFIHADSGLGRCLVAYPLIQDR